MEPTAPFLAVLRDSEKYSDLRIKCGDNTVFNVHRAVVCLQSEYFSKLCDGQLKEATTDTVELPEKPEDIDRMLSYMYTADYSATQSTTDTDTEDVLDIQLTNMRMYFLADKYLIPKLKSRALNKFNRHKSDKWATGIDNIVREVYSTTQSSDLKIRNAVAMACVDYDTADIVHSSIFKEFPEAHIDLLNAKIRKRDEQIKKLQGEVNAKSVFEAELKRLRKDHPEIAAPALRPFRGRRG